MLTLLMLGLFVEPAAMPNVGAPPARCGTDLIQAQSQEPFQAQGRSRATQTPSLLDRSVQPQEVRRYLLLDRRDENNCPLPISFPVSGQPQALGRELGRESRPLSRTAPPIQPSTPVAPGD